MAGEALPDRAARSRGLYLLHLLLGTEIRHGHLSPTPVAGRGPGDLRPGFDQRPDEAAAIGAACAQAYEATDDTHWLGGVEMSWAWFFGDNDASTPMFDLSTGAGFDRLQRSGRSPDQGAESTLAALATIQHVRRLVPVKGDAGVVCKSCPHAVALHDRIALRYCEATRRMVLPRRCICPGDAIDAKPDPTSAPRSK